MSFVAVKCTQCGADIEIDDTKESGICKYCGTAFIMEKAMTSVNTYVTNNFAGANVTINNSNNMEGLLKLAKRELQAKYYHSDNLLKYLDEIVINFSDGSEKIKDLFSEMGLYQLAERVIETEEQYEHGYEPSDLSWIEHGYGISYLLRTYDSENVMGWLLDWEISDSKFVETGENVIRYSDELKRAEYEKKVYSYFVEHGPKCDAYKKYLNAVPKEYIMDNPYIQDLIIKMASTIHRQDEKKERAVIEQLTNMLPENRRQEILRISPSNKSSGGCYIATCVYGSYDCPQVWTLRRYRDDMLDVTWYGRLFIKCYYAISPILVKWFGEGKWFRHFWKSKLDKMVFDLNERGVENKYYQDK